MKKTTISISTKVDSKPAYNEKYLKNKKRFTEEGSHCIFCHYY